MSLSGRYFYRCHSSSSAGGLVSGKGRSCGQKIDLRLEYQNHSQLYSSIPTALVSTSSRVFDTLVRAFRKLDHNNENPNEIFMSIIYVPNEDKHIYHHAEGLAKNIQSENPGWFRNEYVFEWEIPEENLVHTASVATLICRGFDRANYHVPHGPDPTSQLREGFTRWAFPPSSSPYENGLTLGLVARYFGARAPVRQIALQLLCECFPNRFIDYEDQIVRIPYPDRQSIYLDFEDIHDIEDGIDTAVLEWWLADPDFVHVWKSHCARTAQILEDLQWLRCDIAAPDDSDSDDNIEEYERQKQQLQEKGYQADIDIENDAISLGL